MQVFRVTPNKLNRALLRWVLLREQWVHLLRKDLKALKIENMRALYVKALHLILQVQGLFHRYGTFHKTLRILRQGSFFKTPVQRCKRYRVLLHKTSKRPPLDK
jgi:hypothetical protein